MRLLALTGLCCTAGLVAWATPRLLPHSPAGPATKTPVAHIVSPEPEPVAPPSLGSGILSLDVGLDRPLAPGSGNERYVTLAVHGPGSAQRRPVDLVVLLDTSGSMRPRPKIEAARRALVQLAGQLEAGDRLGLVTFSDDASILRALEPVDRLQPIRELVRELAPTGATQVAAGLERAASVFSTRTSDRSRRIVLLSDGRDTGGGDLPALASTIAAQHISISTVAFGRDEQEGTLREISLVGGANHHYAEDGADLRGILDSELQDAGSVVASGAVLEVRPSPHVELVDALGWPTTPIEGGWALHRGDVAERQVVHVVFRARLRGVPGDVFDASLTYRDHIASAQARESIVANAEVVSLAQDLQPSPTWTQTASDALAAEQLERCRMLIEQGNTSGANHTLARIEPLPGAAFRPKTQAALDALRERLASPLPASARRAVVENLREMSHELTR